jgi:hypothetical protein
MKYKDFEAVVVFDEEANIFNGEVVNIKDVITFQGASTTELRKAFEDSVEDYLAFCKERGESKLEALLLEGLNSGDPIKITSKYLEDKRSHLVDQSVKKTGTLRQSKG